jgi:hypothetical protein
MRFLLLIIVIAAIVFLALTFLRGRRGGGL